MRKEYFWKKFGKIWKKFYFVKFKTHINSETYIINQTNFYHIIFIPLIFI